MTDPESLNQRQAELPPRAGGAPWRIGWAAAAVLYGATYVAWIEFGNPTAK